MITAIDDRCYKLRNVDFPAKLNLDIISSIWITLFALLKGILYTSNRLNVNELGLTPSGCKSIFQFKEQFLRIIKDIPAKQFTMLDYLIFCFVSDIKPKYISDPSMAARLNSHTNEIC